MWKFPTFWHCCNDEISPETQPGAKSPIGRGFADQVWTKINAGRKIFLFSFNGTYWMLRLICIYFKVWGFPGGVLRHLAGSFHLFFNSEMQNFCLCTRFFGHQSCPQEEHLCACPSVSARNLQAVLGWNSGAPKVIYHIIYVFIYVFIYS